MSKQLSELTLEEVVEAQVRACRELVAKGKHMTPQLVMFKADDLQLLLITSNDPMTAVPILLMEYQPDKFTLASEFWVFQAMISSGDAARLLHMPRQERAALPNKADGIGVIGRNRQGVTIAKTFTVDRISGRLDPFGDGTQCVWRLPKTW